MAQFNIIDFSSIVSYLFFYYFLCFIFLDLFQIWVFGIFRFADIQVIYFIYLSIITKMPQNSKELKYKNLSSIDDCISAVLNNYIDNVFKK